MNKFRIIKRVIPGLFLAGVIALFFSFTSLNSYFDIAKNLDIFASLYREVTTYYVDDVEPSKLIKKGINAMLESLDPYTNYISEDEIEDFRFVTTGQYGGVGAIIGQQNDEIMIIEPYEGFAAHKAGLRGGDIIIAIDGKSTKGKNTNDVSKILKGQPGTDIILSVIRSKDGKKADIKVTREEIKIDNVQYSTLLKKDIGYINLKGFTQKAGNEVKEAFYSLKEKGAKKIILDLRDNPGGLLNEAVTISNFFIHKGKEIVSTRGKVKEWDKVYEATNPAMDTDVPIVVLINRGSASASEIVSGVIQDYDRGIIIGEKSFGKGLVQTTRPLSYKAQLKVTTAKYYTPSGRCIQAVDYTHKNEDGSVGKIADSLKSTFKTKNGRLVFDGGGIEPDLKIERKNFSGITLSLIQKRLLFDYAVKFRNEHDSIPPAANFNFSDEEFNKFTLWLTGKEYDYTTKTEKALEELIKQAKSESYFSELTNDFQQLESKVKHNKTEDLARFKEEIKEQLRGEIIKLYYFQKGGIESSFDKDEYIASAVEILNNPVRYEQILKTTKK